MDDSPQLLKTEKIGFLKGKPIWFWVLISLGGMCCICMIPILALRMILDRDSSERKARIFKNITVDRAKGIGTGMLLYTYDNDDRLPSLDGWEESLEPYTKTGGIFTAFNETRFAMNKSASLRVLGDLQNPTLTPIFFLSVLPGPSATGSQEDVTTVLGKECVFTFADGVGRSLGEERVESLNWNMK